MQPLYFHTRLTYREADDYLCGMRRRCRAGYDQARMVSSIIGRLFAKNYTIPTFPWEEDEKRTGSSEMKPPTEDEIHQLQAEAKEWEKMMNAENRK